MRHTEFWALMDQVLGEAYSRSWADLTVIGELGGRTARQALADGEPPKRVWAAVRRVLELPETYR